MDNTKEPTINIGSFCTGYGGLDIGIRRVLGKKMRVVFNVEIEAFACTNVVAKIEEGKLDAAPIWTDIKTFDGKPFRGKVHGIIGGYPCQPFSNAGKRQGTDDPRHLFPYILEHVRTIRPVWCFFENVSGHLNLGFDQVYKSLRDLGYKVEAGLFTAAEIGAPHKRERLFILAVANAHRAAFRRGLDSNEKRDGAEKIQRCNEQFRLDCSSKVLAHAKGTGTLRKSRSVQQADGRQGRTLLREPIGADAKLADTRHRDGIKRSCGESKELNRQNQRTFPDYESHRMWPARPDQEQYEWEQPRTVKSGMGRTVDGFASWVDELQLLGNGVVPREAELAFRTLLDRILS